MNRNTLHWIEEKQMQMTLDGGKQLIEDIKQIREQGGTS